MVKKLWILTVLLLLSSTTFSQKDTSKICFEYKIAKRIAVDLVKGDSAIAELKLTKDLVNQLNEKISYKDSVIKVYIKKEINYKAQIDNYSKITNKQKDIIVGLEGDVTKLERKNKNLKKGLKLLGGGFLATVTTILILTSLK
jgi:hypothetical protein